MSTKKLIIVEPTIQFYNMRNKLFCQETEQKNIFITIYNRLAD